MCEICGRPYDHMPSEVVKVFSHARNRARHTTTLGLRIRLRRARRRTGHDPSILAQRAAIRAELIARGKAALL